MPMTHAKDPRQRARPRTMRDPIGNDKMTQTILGHLGNAKTDCLNDPNHDALDAGACRQRPPASAACQRRVPEGGEPLAAPVTGHEGFAQTFFLF